MGVDFFDVYTVGHFLGGFISGIITPKGHEVLSFIVFNGIHLLMECHEHDCHPYYLHRETLINHIGDILFFLIGWFVGYILLSRKISCTAKVWLCCTFMLGTASDVYYEYIRFKSEELNGRWILVLFGVCILTSVYLIFRDLGFSMLSTLFIIGIVCVIIYFSYNNDHSTNILPESENCKRTKYTPKIHS